MVTNLQFESETTVNIWNNYFRRVEKTLRQMPRKNRNELILEIKGHILESFAREVVGDESVKLLSALEKMGQPEEFLHPICADYLLNKAANSFNPGALLWGLVHKAYTGLRNAVISFFLIMGYIITAGFGMLPILKLIYPAHVGVFYSEETGLGNIGYSSNPAGNEILGYWFIPVSIAITVLLYLFLNLLLRFLIRKK